MKKREEDHSLEEENALDCSLDGDPTKGKRSRNRSELILGNRNSLLR